MEGLEGHQPEGLSGSLAKEMLGSLLESLGLHPEECLGPLVELLGRHPQGLLEHLAEGWGHLVEVLGCLVEGPQGPQLQLKLNL